MKGSDFMNERWKMNKIGFINFWLYDEEIFHFYDGKLLLRGQNGSGKSITTQSFIPFILDGDKTPSRLDPFGSVDRKMEYYFLGDGEKEESTGYLFLEFKMDGTNQFRTIGIGQRAQRGKPISFWGFILLDGRRIGHDFFLYRETGTKKIPYSKQELKNLIGENNVFVDSQKEYMFMVNKYLFKFPRIEQYDQFIRLMIKIRSPKLSRGLKPSEMYGILNDSLQTLSDEDLRTLVEAMEKLDDMQNKLDSLKNSYSDLKMIRTEYDKYNKYMLRKKAKVYIEANGLLENLSNKFENDKKLMIEKEQSSQQCAENIVRIQLELESAKNELQAIGDFNIEVSVAKENDLKYEKKQKEEDVLSENKKIEKYRNDINLYEAKKREKKYNIEVLESKMKVLLTELNLIDEIINYNKKTQIEEVISKEDDASFKALSYDIRNELNSLQKTVDSAILALQVYDNEKDKLSDVEQDFYKADEYKSNCKSELDEAERVETQCRDEIVNEFYKAADENTELVITNNNLLKIVEAIRGYYLPKDISAIKSVTDEIYKDKYRILNHELYDNKNVIGLLNEKLLIAKKELAEIENLKEPIPIRKKNALLARKKLEDNNILFTPFYMTVEFSNILEEEKALIEAQMLDMGLLDAIIVSKKDYLKAKSILSEFSDSIINVDEYGNGNFAGLVCKEVSEEIKPVVEKILSNIFTLEGNGNSIVLGSDGYFKNGVLEGYSKAEEKAVYIGVEARKNEKARRIKEKERECEDLSNQISIIEENIASINERFKWLEHENISIPTFDNLDQALELLKSQNDEYSKAIKIYEEKEYELKKIKMKIKNSWNEIIKCCKNIPYERNIETFMEVKNAIYDYSNCLVSIGETLNSTISTKNGYMVFVEKIHTYGDIIDMAYGQIDKTNRRISEITKELERIENYLNNSEVIEKADKIKGLKESIDTHEKQLKNFEINIIYIKGELEKLRYEIEEAQNKIIEATANESLTKKIFAEELELRFVINDLSDNMIRNAQASIKLFKENEKEKSDVEMEAGLQGTFSKYCATLGNYAAKIEECFISCENMLRKRSVICFVWNGKKVHLNEFNELLLKTIEDSELLIKKEDRKLFEDIMSDTISRKLSNRIADSRKWVNDMSAMMRGMETSMGLSFSLDWKAKSAVSEDEMDMSEFEKILSRDKKLLTSDDIEKVSSHFKSKIQYEKQIAEERNETVIYPDLIRNSLDYRSWFEFRMHYYKNGEIKRELTNSAFNKFSGGEKAMAMYVPLFAAVNAHLKKCDDNAHPRIIALDEAFAGVDDMNISSMFEMVDMLDFDYIMNSQSLWGCYKTVKSLSIADLSRPANSDVVTVIYYTWNGKERCLNEY